jgi:hypothetical protein
MSASNALYGCDHITKVGANLLDDGVDSYQVADAWPRALITNTDIQLSECYPCRPIPSFNGFGRALLV